MKVEIIADFYINPEMPNMLSLCPAMSWFFKANPRKTHARPKHFARISHMMARQTREAVCTPDT